MSQSHPLSAKIVSNASSETWSYVFEFKKDNTSVYILVLKGQSREIIPEVIWNGQSPNLTQFKEQVTEFEAQFPASNYLSYIKHFVATSKDLFALHAATFELSVIAITDSELSIVSTGSASALLLRSGQLVALNKPTTRITSVTGMVQETDVIVAATSAFVEAIPQGVLKATMSQSDPQGIVESLTPGILARENPAIACVVISIPKSAREKVAPAPTTNSVQPAPYMPKRGVKPLLVGVIDRILTRLPEKRLYVNPQERSQEAKSRRKLPILIGGVLLILLTSSVVIGIQRQQQLKIEKAFSEELSIAEQKLEEAKTLKGTNDSRARELLLEANSIIEGLKDKEGKSANYDLVAQSVSDNLGAIGGIYIASPSLYLDLALVSSGFVGEKLTASEGRMLVLDRERNKLVSIDIASKKTQIVAGPSDLNNVLDIALYSDRNFVIDNDGISEVNGTKRQLINKDWGNTVQILAFAGNLYLLDQDQDRIVKFNGAGTGFSPGVNWINEGSKGEFSQVRSFAVDGAFWFLETTGEIDKWSVGREEIFLLSNVPNSSFVDLYTNEELSELYLLDSENSRVIVTDKRGNYIAEYQAPEIGEASEVIVSYLEKKIIFLSQSKLYSIDLKHK